MALLFLQIKKRAVLNMQNSRYTTIMAQRNMKLLGRSVDLKLLISQHINRYCVFASRSWSLTHLSDFLSPLRGLPPPQLIKLILVIVSCSYLRRNLEYVIRRFEASDLTCIVELHVQRFVVRDCRVTR